MPTNPTLPTYEQILERVKAQDWGHDLHSEVPSIYSKLKCRNCGIRVSFVNDINKEEYQPCPVHIAQAIQAAMVEALRWAGNTLPLDSKCVCLEAADALEKS
jgi:hypothetical protein